MSLNSHNRRAMQKFANNLKKDLEKEFKRRPIKVPLEISPTKNPVNKAPRPNMEEEMKPADEYSSGPASTATISILLMEWIYRQQDPTVEFFSFSEFADSSNIGRSKVFDAGRLLEMHGLAEVIEDADGLDGHLTAKGKAEIERIKSERSDKGRRVRVLAHRMLAWLHDREDEEPPIDWSEFLEGDKSFYLGLQFSATDTKRAAQYLYQKGYISSQKMDQELDGFIRPTLTALGMDIVMTGSPLSSENNSRISSTVINNNGPVIHGDANGSMQLSWGDQNSMVQKSTQDIASGHEDLAKLITQILREIKDLRLEGSDEEIVNEAGREILEEVTSEQPRTSRIKKSMAALKGVLSGVAYATVAGVNQGAQELAKSLLSGMHNLVI